MYNRVNWKDGQTELCDTNFNIMDKGISDIDSQISQVSSPNLLINGDFQIWQRGTNFSGGGYTADRWILNSDTKATGAKTAKGILITSTTNGTWTNFSQYVEGSSIKSLVGRPLTLTFKLVNACSNIVQMWCKDKETNNYYGSKVFNAVASDTFSFTFTLGQFTQNIECGIQVKSVAGSAIEIQWAKLEASDHMTPFIPRPCAEELALCQRYYEACGHTRIVCPAGTRSDCNIIYKATKRVVPNLNIYPDTSNDLNKVRRESDSVLASIAIYEKSQESFGIVDVVNGNAGDTYVFVWSADAELY
jgi:hypothetical protein